MNKTLGSILLITCTTLYTMRSSCVPVSMEEQRTLVSQLTDSLQLTFQQAQALSIYLKTQAMLLQRQQMLLEALPSAGNITTLPESIATALRSAIKASTQYEQIKTLVQSAERELEKPDGTANTAAKRIIAEINKQIQDLISACDKYKILTDKIWESMKAYEAEIKQCVERIKTDPRCDAVVEYFNYILKDVTLEELTQQPHVLIFPMLKKLEENKFAALPIQLTVSLKPVIEKPLLNYNDHIRYLMIQYQKAKQDEKTEREAMLDSMIEKMQAPGINHFMVKRLLVPNMQNFEPACRYWISESDKAQEIQAAVSPYQLKVNIAIVGEKIRLFNSMLSAPLTEIILSEPTIMDAIAQYNAYCLMALPTEIAQIKQLTDQAVVDLSAAQLQLANASKYPQLHHAIVEQTLLQTYYQRQIERMKTEIDATLQLMQSQSAEDRKQNVLLPIVQYLQNQTQSWQAQNGHEVLKSERKKFAKKVKEVIALGKRLEKERKEAEAKKKLAQEQAMAAQKAKSTPEEPVVDSAAAHKGVAETKHADPAADLPTEGDIEGHDLVHETTQSQLLLEETAATAQENMEALAGDHEMAAKNKDQEDDEKDESQEKADEADADQEPPFTHDTKPVHSEQTEPALVLKPHQQVAMQSLLTLASIVPWADEAVTAIKQPEHWNLVPETGKPTLQYCIEMFFKQLAHVRTYKDCIKTMYFIVHGMDKEQIPASYDTFTTDMRHVPYGILFEDCNTPSELLATSLVEIYNLQDKLYVEAQKQIEDAYKEEASSSDEEEEDEAAHATTAENDDAEEANDDDASTTLGQRLHRLKDSVVEHAANTTVGAVLRGVFGK